MYLPFYIGHNLKSAVGCAGGYLHEKFEFRTFMGGLLTVIGGFVSVR